MFIRVDSDGNQIRRKVVVDCSEDEILTEQSHKDEVNINNIVKRHGVDLIAKTAALQTAEYQMDDITGNDFQEAMLKVTKAQQTFESMPSALRKKFDNNPAQFMDFVQNPDNQDSLVEMGLAQRLPTNQPVEVIVTNQAEPVSNPETPPE